MQQAKKVVILLPTYNERENLAKFVGDVLNEEKNASGWEFEVLIVDSHSPDGTFEVAEELAKSDKRIHTLLVGPGLGVALVEGHTYSIKNFHPDALAQMDADGQVSVEVLPKLLAALDDGYTLALGSRFVPGGENKLSFSRRVFSMGLSVVCRVIMGPFSIKEFANSARAFTPELFEKIDKDRLPWKEQTFIIQPAFLNEAILAGAKYKEVPLVFKNRAEGYSKNKVLNYSFDVLTYVVDARFRKMGWNIPFFRITHKSKTLVKFGMVGLVGTVIDFCLYKLFINQFGLSPATAKGFSTSVAIVNNFILNNFWTFRKRQTQSSFWQRMAIFVGVSLGGLFLSVLIIKFLHNLYGDGDINLGGFKLAYNTIYFLVTVPTVLIWNFSANHFITFRSKR